MNDDQEYYNKKFGELQPFLDGLKNACDNAGIGVTLVLSVKDLEGEEMGETNFVLKSTPVTEFQKLLSGIEAIAGEPVADVLAAVSKYSGACCYTHFIFGQAAFVHLGLIATGKKSDVENLPKYISEYIRGGGNVDTLNMILGKIQETTGSYYGVASHETGKPTTDEEIRKDILDKIKRDGIDLDSINYKGFVDGIHTFTQKKKPGAKNSPFSAS